MFPKWASIMGLAALAALAGCGRRPAPPPEPAAKAPAAAEFAASPEVLAVRRAAGGVVMVEGAAAPGALVRLGTPGGAAVSAPAGGDGRFRLALPASSEPRIFGLSARTPGRVVQAQGYVLIGPAGKAALLRSGAGALRLDKAAGPRLGAVDFDREGAAIVSGEAPAQAWISLKLDDRQAAEARADSRGRYAISLTRLPAGAHSLEVVGDGFSRAARVEVTPAPPLVAGPLHSQFTQGGLRVDWLTPGGGVQSTVLLD